MFCRLVYIQSYILLFIAYLIQQSVIVSKHKPHKAFLLPIVNSYQREWKELLVKWQITYIHRKFLGFLFSVIILIWTFWDSKLGYNFKVKKIDENLGSINLTNIDNLIKIVHVIQVMLSIFYQRTAYLMVPFLHLYTHESKFIRCFQIALYSSTKNIITATQISVCKFFFLLNFSTFC